jgi:LysR family glycine cleavage system transcriptional activator
MPGEPLPFAGLRVLEAACRLRSYSAAGELLGVTHSAVSQTVRRLEAAYGHALFRRRNGQMAPTDAALALAAAYREAEAILQRTSRQLAQASQAPTLVLSTLPSFANLWLSPRLKRLGETLPDITVEVRTGRELANLESDGVDVAIRNGVGPWPPLRAERLFEHLVFPVCSPEFRKRHGPLSDEDIARLPLILEDDDLWSPWFRAAGVKAQPARRGPSFDDAGMVIEAAAAGFGVALVRRAHADAALTDGRLVRLSQTEARTGVFCSVVWRPDTPKIAMVRRFTDWLLAECGASGLLEAA